MANINIRLVLYAAVDIETQEVKTMPTQSWDWDSMLVMAQKQLQPTDSGHVLRDYQESLLFLDKKGKEMLEEARQGKRWWSSRLSELLRT